MLIVCVSVLTLSCYAAQVSQNFTIPTGSNVVYTSKMYPAAGSGTWSVGITGASQSPVTTATLYYNTSSGQTLIAGQLYEIAIGYQKSKPGIIFASTGYYACIVAKTTDGVIGTTSITQ